MAFWSPNSLLILLSSTALIHGATTNPRIAIAVLNPGFGRTENVTGSVLFTETANGIRVTGSIIGFEPGQYGFHIHELGDTTTCDTTGPHFDPHEKLHGGREHEVRHVGDFGNVQFAGNGTAAVATIDFVDRLITFDGENNILGRSLVLHKNEDDLGKTDHEMSPITGNAGPRVACGVIGIRSGVWNSGVTAYSSLTLTIFGIIFLIFK